MTNECAACQRLEGELECERVRRIAAESNHEALLKANQRMAIKTDEAVADNAELVTWLDGAETAIKAKEDHIRKLAQCVVFEHDANADLLAKLRIKGDQLEAATIRINQLETECGHLQADVAELSGKAGELEVERDDLRGLLREAVEAPRFDEIPESWFERSITALDGKP